MKILVTGSKGFIGKNLVAELRNQGYTDILEYDRDTEKSLINKYTKDCDFVFHLAGVTRPKNEEEFLNVNFGFTSELLELLKEHNNKSPVLFTSSIHAERDNPYGKSKKAAEDLLFDYSKETDIKVIVYRLSNSFGKWSRPNYSSVVATYCYNIARGLDIQINNPLTELKLCYIDDIVGEFLRILKDNSNKKQSELLAITSKSLNLVQDYGTKMEKLYSIPVAYNIKLGELAKVLKSFKESKTNLNSPNMEYELTKKLYSTYLSFLPAD